MEPELKDIAIGRPLPKCINEFEVSRECPDAVLNFFVNLNGLCMLLALFVGQRRFYEEAVLSRLAAWKRIGLVD
jgi:hypothetical protein